MPAGTSVVQQESRGEWYGGPCRDSGGVSSKAYPQMHSDTTGVAWLVVTVRLNEGEFRSSGVGVTCRGMWQMHVCQTWTKGRHPNKQAVGWLATQRQLADQGPAAQAPSDAEIPAGTACHPAPRHAVDLPGCESCYCRLKTSRHSLPPRPGCDSSGGTGSSRSSTNPEAGGEGPR